MPRERTTTHAGPANGGNARRAPPPYAAKQREHHDAPPQSNHQIGPPRSYALDKDASVYPLDSLPQTRSYNRQPSAHLSEIDSLDGTQSPSQVPIEDINVDYYDGFTTQYEPSRPHKGQQHRFQSISRQSTRGGNAGNGQAHPSFVKQGYPPMPPTEPKHPSAHRLARAKDVTQAPRSTGVAEGEVHVGRTIAPKAFQPMANPDNSGGQNGPRRPTRGVPEPFSNAEHTQRHGPARRGPAAHSQAYYPPSKPVYPRSKLNQSTKFDTPSEKGQVSSPDQGSVARSSDGQGHESKAGRRRNVPGNQSDAFNAIDLEDSPSTRISKYRSRPKTAISAPGVNMEGVGMPRKPYSDLDVDIDESFDLGAGAGLEVWDLPQGAFAGHSILPPTPPSETALPVVLRSKPIVNMLSPSDIALEDPLADLGEELALLEAAEDGSGTQLKLKMPKTVAQVVSHVTNVLASKVSQAQGDQAIKSFESWDWSRLPVLASEIEGSIKEMEQAIHFAGQGQLGSPTGLWDKLIELDKQAGIEETKRKRVDMEAGNTEQYEEFRKDFREACEMMQQPGKLGKKFKFGPF